MPTRREFIRTLGQPAAVAVVATFHPAGVRGILEATEREMRSPAEVARDEAFWMVVQNAFAVDRSLINLNNGGVSPAPELVQEALKRHLDYSNTAPVHTMWRVLEPQSETVRTMLARMFGCDAEEMAVVRNASEGLQICQFGFDLRPGDEVVTTNQDYGRMITTWQQRERREGIRLVQISIPTPAEDPAEVVRRFESAITPRTRLIHMCHMINLTGQILPVKEVVTMARARGIPVIVDGAHAFAHFDFTHRDLDCDYYASSLHKWLTAPIGTGMLYVRREKIADLWPLMAAPQSMAGDIRKFEEIGTHPAANHLAIAEAVRFNEAIGLKRKEARLIYLRDRWARPLLEHERVRLHTSLKPGLSCGLANVQIVGVDPGALASHLWERHRIVVTPIKHAEFEGVRVTPNVYTTLAEIDHFVEVMAAIARKGLPES
jgi:isopenicillin-N epimerase